MRSSELERSEKGIIQYVNRVASGSHDCGLDVEVRAPKYDDTNSLRRIRSLLPLENETSATSVVERFVTEKRMERFFPTLK